MTCIVLYTNMYAIRLEMKRQLVEMAFRSYHANAETSCISNGKFP